jgi:flavin-dependent dehydrogenase
MQTGNPSPLNSVETSETDLYIVGGGPAGLACAIAATQRGLTVEVADGMMPPIDKACGEGLMPDTIEALTILGVDLSGTESFPFCGIRFLGAEEGEAPVSTEASFPVGHGVGMHRLLLHQRLIDRATALGVRLNWQTVVQGIEPVEGDERSIVRTNRNTVRPRFIVGADGHQSRVRTWAGLDRATTSARRIGLRQHFAIEPWADRVEVYWSEHGQAYVTPISPQQICIAFVASQKFENVPQALSHFPQLQQRLRLALATDQPRGSITFSRKLHRVTQGNVALIGDASGSVDAVTGEGLGLCFRQAIALAEALKSGDLAHYQQAHRSLLRLPYLMARSMILLDHSPGLRRLTLRTLERFPWIFQQLLQIHIGHVWSLPHTTPAQPALPQAAAESVSTR